MRINGNFFMNSSLFNRHSAVSGMFGSRNAGSVNMPDRNSVNKYSKTYMKDGILYHRGNRTESKLYTRQGTLAGARQRQHPNQRKPFYSGQEILDAIKKYDGYTLGYDGKTAYFQGAENVYRKTIADTPPEAVPWVKRCILIRLTSTPHWGYTIPNRCP